jgi:hypothetical protein
MSDLLTRKDRRGLGKVWFLLAVAGIALTGAPRGHEGAAVAQTGPMEVRVVPGKPLVHPRAKAQAKQGPPNPHDPEPGPWVTFPEAWKHGGLPGVGRKAMVDVGHAALHAAKEPHVHQESEGQSSRPESESSGSG